MDAEGAAGGGPRHDPAAGELAAEEGQVEEAPAVDGAVGPSHRTAGEPHQDLATVPAPPQHFDPLDDIVRIEARENPPALFRVCVHVGPEIDGQQLLLGLVAEHPHQCGVDGEEPPLDGRPVDGVGRVLHQGAVALLRLTQRGLRAAPLGDVGPDADHARHRPLGVADRRIPRFEHDAEDLDGR